jgi:hypothetical protein
LYDPKEPGDISGTVTGKWEVVEDDVSGTLGKIVG